MSTRAACVHSPVARGTGGVYRGKGSFRAKVCIESITLYGPFTSREKATEHHEILRGFRDAVLFQSGKLGFRSACLSMLGNLEGLNVSAYLSLHVARWLGSAHVTSPVVPVNVALDLREQLLDARARGWEAFREAWVETSSAGVPT